ncbi:UDP-2,4-diacetamido-2,4,6-trideoxy-beta-L-altropyranose hydrolase [Paenibacillus sp. DXFW5]|uniref:UDP-2,4-diacetamido-2,4, 6-trideoxy-beta-L-altropyranose hydrolase n=1 Tax=Paenibacillus rhizolycopersici TaxID=2780073 RepID=A0ABS2H732_9BACL|nr:UDP-2,4-diacetamido-2,4,6-trideoxy-beta-L-altropyranose hydrolase [Paenibacillus rhizolycopersici]MBM6997247.1 UDP-2,4-diacetamido-2,4,6-trideoxy-beta-L-altropyranose hydrolase [Paenibacillus rhizolycopersici]
MNTGRLTILIRTDASSTIGSGHVMRCLTIADNFRKLGHEVQFWMERLPGHLIDLVEGRGFTVVQRAIPAHLLIVDHYQLDKLWEQSVRTIFNKIVVIDDLANRQHDCDLLLDQNVVAGYERRYDDLVPVHCRKLLGPKYLIIRDEFIEARTCSLARRGRVERLLVFMGGSDPTGETLKVIDALVQVATRFKHIDVVVGSSNMNRYEVKRRCEALQLQYHCQIDYLARLMQEADFAIGAGGTAMWERCYVGLPSSSTVVADNQHDTTIEAAKLGAIIHLGWHEEVDSSIYSQLIEKLPLMSEQLVSMSKQGLNITEAQGIPNVWIREILRMFDK